MEPTREGKQDLGTFGAVLSFGLSFVSQSTESHAHSMQLTSNVALRGLLEHLVAEGRKAYATLERTRRENVTEMILEPIVGLDASAYELEIREPTGDAEIVQMTLRLEERDRQFLQAASVKVPIPEVARVFRKMALSKEKSLAQARSFLI